AEAEVKARGEENRGRLDALKPQAEAATKAVRAAEEKFASGRALQRQAVESFAELDNLAGAQKCRTCGQPLTAKHLADEKVTRGDAVAAAEERVRQASAELSAARERERGFAAQLRELEEQIQAARDEFKDKRHHAQQAQNDLARFVHDCQREYT